MSSFSASAPMSPPRGRPDAGSPAASSRSSSNASPHPSLAQMQRTMPRMTDSTTGPGGPSSLKFAALSVNSYQLDSPPFIGTAVGSDGIIPDHSLASQPASHSSPVSAPAQAPSQTRTAQAPPARAQTQTQMPTHTQPQPHAQAQSQLQPQSQSQSQSQPQLQASPDHSLPDHPDDDASHDALDAHTPGATPFVQPFFPAPARARTPPPPNGDVTALVLDEEPERPLYSSFHNDVDGVEDSTSVVTGEEEVDAETAAVQTQVPVQSETKAGYRFPKHRLPRRMHDEGKTPLVIVACGSFSPPTYLHLRIFEMAKDAILESGQYELLGGYYSPVSDHYKKPGLAPSKHRVRMCELAVEKTSTWLMVDAWESLQDEYQRTAVVLDHFDECLNNTGSDHGILLSDGTRKPIRIMLLAGGDLIQSMGEPGVWAEADIRHILGRFGCLIVERTGADVWSFLLSHDLLWAERKHLLVIKQTIYNDISSSKVRLFIKRNMSVKYLLPNSVINYINQYRLYRLPDPVSESPQ